MSEKISQCEYEPILESLPCWLLMGRHPLLWEVVNVHTLPREPLYSESVGKVKGVIDMYQCTKSHSLPGNHHAIHLQKRPTVQVHVFC